MTFDKKLEQFIGTEGISVLQKSMGHIDSKNKDQYLDALQILPRAVLSWIFNFTKNLEKGVSKKVKVPSIDLLLEITKNTPTKFSGKWYNEETNVAFENENLANLSMHLLKSLDCLETPDAEITDEAEQEIQKAIDFMVERFCFTNRTTIKLAKNELSAKCPDCLEKISLGEDGNRLCICFRSLNKFLHLSKNTDGTYRVQFPSSWDKKNINFLIKAFKKMGE